MVANESESRKRAWALSWCYLFCSCLSHPYLTAPDFTSLKFVHLGLVPGAGRDEAEQVRCCPENLCICRIKDSQELMGALVCQVSLLDSMCQGFAVSDEAQTPEPNCWQSKIIYCSCWQGLVRGCCLLPCHIPWRFSSSQASITHVLGCSGNTGIWFLLSICLFSL